MIKGKAAKFLYEELAASHTSDGAMASVRQSNTVVCINDKLTDKTNCTIRIDGETGEVMKRDLHYGQ